MEDDKKENSLVDIRKFLNDSERPLESEEFMEFWRSLTDDEKTEFKRMELPR